MKKDKKQPKLKKDKINWLEFLQTYKLLLIIPFSLLPSPTHRLFSQFIR